RTRMRGKGIDHVTNWVRDRKISVAAYEQADWTRIACIHNERTGITRIAEAGPAFESQLPHENAREERWTSTERSIVNANRASDLCEVRTGQARGPAGFCHLHSQ